jgi:asparagine synthase (glutamine-hydrolysing)
LGYKDTGGFVAGIFGCISKSKEHQYSSDNALQDIQDQLHYRGTKKQFSFSLIDVSLFGVPDENICEDEHHQLIVIGTLYEPKILEIFHQWKQIGIQALSSYNGSFLIVFIEKKERCTQKIHFIRSSDGVFSLYFYERETDILFCSEQRLLQQCAVRPEIAFENIAELLSFRYVHAPRTLIKKLTSLPAGHYAQFDVNGEQRIENITLYSWCEIQTDGERNSEHSSERIVEQTSAYIHRSIKKRIQSNTALFLSGGIDSSVLLQHMCSIQKPHKTFTIELEGLQSNEIPFAARVSKIMGAENEVLRIQPEELIESIYQATKIIAAPLTTAAAGVQYAMFKSLQGKVSHIFSGDGGDEVFAGRSMPILIRRMEQNRLVSQLPIGKRLIRSIAKKIGNKDLAVSYENFGMERSIGASRIFIAPDRVDILSDPGLVRPGIRRNVLTPFYQELNSDPINEILHVWQRGWLVEDSLLRSERLSSYFGIQVEYPLLDQDLVDYYATLPGHIKVQRQNFEYIAKWPLREILKPYLSKNMLYRPKRTLLHPLDQWLLTVGKQFLHDRVEEMCTNLAHIFVPSMVKRLEREHLKKEYNHGLRLWNLILFSIWWHQFEEFTNPKT